MTAYFYDGEFLEDGSTIELLSIGIVADDGREYYAVVHDAPWRRVRKHEWLMANVVPHLPQSYGDARNHLPKSWLFNMADPDVKTRALIAREVAEFLTARPDPELWAYYAAYDHVALCQLWGRMIDLPAGIPMWTNDLRQEMARLDVERDDLPTQAGAEHNALADARWNRTAYGILMQRDLENGR